jgi:hypothetical protein
MKNLVLRGTFLAVPVFLLAAVSGPGNPDNTLVASDYKLLAPISHGDLTIFPVVSAKSHDTSSFLTLDEGIRSGEVVVTEVGTISGMIRRRRPLPQSYSRAEVNRCW